MDFGNLTYACKTVCQERKAWSLHRLLSAGCFPVKQWRSKGPARAGTVRAPCTFPYYVLNLNLSQEKMDILVLTGTDVAILTSQHSHCLLPVGQWSRISMQCLVEIISFDSKFTSVHNAISHCLEQGLIDSLPAVGFGSYPLMNFESLLTAVPSNKNK